MCVFCMVHDCVHFTPQSRKATDTHCNDDCKEDLYLLQKKWESPPLMSSGLWMPLQMISLSLQVPVGIPDRLSVDEVEDWAAEEEPEEVYWRLVLHARKHSRRSSE